MGEKGGERKGWGVVSCVCGPVGRVEVGRERGGGRWKVEGGREGGRVDLYILFHIVGAWCVAGIRQKC